MSSSEWIDAGEAALTAVIGDYLDEQENPLARPMALFDRGRRVRALPKGTRHLVVLVHGMACTERCWLYPDDDTFDYGRQLERDRGVTPIYVRYNTGLPIWTNGEDLAALMRELVGVGEDVESVVFIGHSMGGLVIRSACYVGRDDPWLDRTNAAFYLGTPHLGSPLERVGRVATDVMKAIDDPVVQLLGDIADLRSAAVKGLGEGHIVETKETIDPDPTIEHYFAAGKIDVPIANELLGDGLVPVSSATAFEAGSVGHFPGLHHMALAHHRDVYAWIAERIDMVDAPTSGEPETETADDPRVVGYSALAEDAVDAGSRAVQRVHESVATRSYDVLETIPAIAAPSRAVQAVHFGVLRGTYAIVRGVNAVVGASIRSAFVSTGGGVPAKRQ